MCHRIARFHHHRKIARHIFNDAFAGLIFFILVVYELNLISIFLLRFKIWRLLCGQF